MNLELLEGRTGHQPLKNGQLDNGRAFADGLVCRRQEGWRGYLQSVLCHAKSFISGSRPAFS